MKLYDRMMRPGATFTASPECDEREANAVKQLVAEYLPTSVVFEATSVATAISDIRPLPLFHCLMPPYENMWIEGVLPSKDRYGALITASHIRDVDRTTLTLSDPPGATYIIGAYVFLDMETIPRHLNVPRDPLLACAMGFFLDREGVFIPADPERPNSIGKWLAGWPAKEAERSILDTAFMWETIALLNCKNVTTQDNEGRWPNRQARRDAERKGLPGPVKFKTLVVKPLAATGTGDGTRKGSHKERAMHICRGHFSTYTPEKPLFGKYHGTFWIPAHVRGNPEVATIAKDYEVKP